MDRLLLLLNNIIICIFMVQFKSLIITDVS
jgi:hypothetical protein